VRRVEGTFTLNTLLDARHRVIGAVAGAVEAAHEAGCAAARRQFQIPLDAPLDALIASAGGAPYDCNFIQALKAPFDTEGVVRTGGALLWIAQCPLGMREGFLRRAELTDEELERAVRADYRHTDLNWILLRQLVRRLRVALWSHLPAEVVRAMGIEPVTSLEEGMDWLLHACPGRFQYGVVPFANITHATLRA
jgi:nickel-dependent lactate racemase